MKIEFALNSLDIMELTANCLVETCTKLEEVILDVMVDYGLNGYRNKLFIVLKNGSNDIQKNKVFQYVQ